jgi:hypothetical protein
MMERQTYKGKKQSKDFKPREYRSVYSPCQITKQITLPITGIGKTLHQTIESNLSRMLSGKCVVEGYVKPNTIRLITFSSGIIKGENVIFEALFNCEVCFPVAGMNMNCIAKNITKAGITAESADESPSPFKLHVAKDHFYVSDYFNSIQEGDKFVARVIASRFELNDKFVSVIAELVNPVSDDKKKPILIIED